MIPGLGKVSESWIEGWFKLHAYSLILLKNEGTPVVFWGDLYGTEKAEAVGSGLTN